MGDVIEVVGHMSHGPFAYAASIVWNDRLLWITGGFQWFHGGINLKATQYIDITNNDGKSYPGPNLPTPLDVI